MNPFKLEGQVPDGRKSWVWGCGNCMRVCANEQHAKECCVCSYCGKPIEKTNIRETSHRECMHAEWAKRDAERMAKAEKLDVWDGGVFWGDNYYPSIDDAEEAINDQCEDDNFPKYLYVAKQVKIHKVEYSEILEDLSSNFGAEDEIEFNGVEELSKACNAFNEANKDMQWFEEDRKRAVRVKLGPEDLTALVPGGIDQ